MRSGVDTEVSPSSRLGFGSDDDDDVLLGHPCAQRPVGAEEKPSSTPAGKRTGDSCEGAHPRRRHRSAIEDSDSSLERALAELDAAVASTELQVDASAAVVGQGHTVVQAASPSSTTATAMSPVPRNPLMALQPSSSSNGRWHGSPASPPLPSAFGGGDATSSPIGGFGRTPRHHHLGGARRVRGPPVRDTTAAAFYDGWGILQQRPFGLHRDLSPVSPESSSVENDAQDDDDGPGDDRMALVSSPASSPVDQRRSSSSGCHSSQSPLTVAPAAATRQEGAESVSRDVGDVFEEGGGVTHVPNDPPLVHGTKEEVHGGDVGLAALSREWAATQTAMLSRIADDCAASAPGRHRKATLPSAWQVPVRLAFAEDDDRVAAEVEHAGANDARALQPDDLLSLPDNRSEATTVLPAPSAEQQPVTMMRTLQAVPHPTDREQPRQAPMNSGQGRLGPHLSSVLSRYAQAQHRAVGRREDTTADHHSPSCRTPRTTRSPVPTANCSTGASRALAAVRKVKGVQTPGLTSKGFTKPTESSRAHFATDDDRGGAESHRDPNENVDPMMASAKLNTSQKKPPIPAVRDTDVLRRFTMACDAADRQCAGTLPRGVVVNAFVAAAVDHDASKLRARSPLAAAATNHSTEPRATPGRRIALLKQLQPSLEPFIDAGGTVSYPELIASLHRAVADAAPAPQPPERKQDAVLAPSLTHSPTLQEHHQHEERLTPLEGSPRSATVRRIAAARRRSLSTSLRAAGVVPESKPRTVGSVPTTTEVAGHDDGSLLMAHFLGAPPPPAPPLVVGVDADADEDGSFL